MNMNLISRINNNFSNLIFGHKQSFYTQKTLFANSPISLRLCVFA